MGIGDAYKGSTLAGNEITKKSTPAPAPAPAPKPPDTSKRSAPEPESYDVRPSPEDMKCAGCGKPIERSYIVRNGQRFHPEGACRDAWSRSGGGGVFAEAAKPKPYAGEDMVGDPGPWEAKPETPEESAELDRAGVRSPEARAAVLARQPRRMTGPERGELEREIVPKEEQDRIVADLQRFGVLPGAYLEVAFGAALDAIGASVGVSRTAGTTDVDYRDAIRTSIELDRIAREGMPVPLDRPFRVYVAGASKERHRCRGAMKMIQRSGFEITCDWLAAIEAEGLANEGLNDAKRRHYADEDLRGVERADLVWVLAPEAASTGSWTELGAALILRRLGLGAGVIVVSGPARERSIFAVHADFETDHDLEALDWIRACGDKLRGRP